MLLEKKRVVFGAEKKPRKDTLCPAAKRWYPVARQPGNGRKEERDGEEEKRRELETERNQWGKPSLIRHPQIHFNISHSGALAACGFSDRPLGLDIQQCTDADYFRIANRYYSRSDQELLKRTETENLPDLFFRIWTKEESYAKWLGTALGQTIGKENKTGVCHCFVPLPGYQAAVWTDKPEEPEICFRDSATVHPRRSAAESG